MNPSLLLRLSALALTALLLNGCFLSVRHLRDENNMLQARNEQLAQDLAAQRATASGATNRLQSLEDEYTLLKSRAESLEAENRRLNDRVLALQSTLTDSQRASAESVTDQLAARMEEENELRLEIENLSAQLERVAAERDVAESTIAALRKEMETLREENDVARQLAAQLQDEGDEAREARDATAEQLATASTRAEALEKELAETKSQLDALRTQVDALAAENARADSVADAARAAFTTGLAAQVAAGDALVPAEGEPRVLLFSDGLFQSGTVLLSAEGEQLLQAVEKALEGLSYSGLRIEGHTDTVPVRNMPFVDNWDLAAARASTVTRWFDGRPVARGKRLVAESLAYNEPVGSNETTSGRKQNRRVEIVVVP